MPAGLHHPLSRALYERHGDGQIKVTDGSRNGIFTSQGEWVSGELRECDPQLCNWVAGPQMANPSMAESAPDR